MRRRRSSACWRARISERRSCECRARHIRRRIVATLATRSIGSEEASMWSRRAFLRMSGAIGTAAFATASYRDVEAIQAASSAVSGRTPEDVAQDETYWREIQGAFTLDRTLTN